LQIWSKCDKIINETIKVFTDMATGYSNSKLISKLETIKYIIKNHSSNKFDFLNEPSNLKSRIQFYTILTKLLFIDDYTEDDFLNFVAPCKTLFHYK
jgi:exportin-7